MKYTTFIKDMLLFFRGKKEQPPINEEELHDLMVSYLRDLFKGQTQRGKDDFLKCKEKDLFLYNSTLGRDLRNTFHLWDIPWEPEIKDGVDYSDNHPDQRAMKAIKAFWHELQKEVK